MSFEKKIPVSFFQPQSEQMIVKDIGLKHVLGYFTGSTSITAQMKESKIKLKFVHNVGTGTGLVLNTSIMSVKFPVTDRYLSDFRTAFVTLS